MSVLWTAFLVFCVLPPAAGEERHPKLSAPERFKNRTTLSASAPRVQYTAHNRGNIQLAVANNGTFGTLGSTIPDPFTGEAIPSCIYPKGSDLVYLWVAAVWIGAVVGRDTLVSTANEDWYRTTEFWPDAEPFGEFVYKSIDVNSPFYDTTAYSEQDIMCEYMDTLVQPGVPQHDPVDNRPHRPLRVKVTQRSMAWSYAYADDFILFDYRVQNIGTKDLRDVYIGIYVDGDAWHTTNMGPEGWNDDIVGFYRFHPAPEGDDCTDTVNVAYNADNDGDPTESGQWDFASPRGVVGVRVVRTPSTSLKYSFNWWIISYSDVTRDFGPRMRGTPDDPWRNFGGRLGTPVGDKNKYYVLRHEEFDYDLLFTAIDHSAQGYLPPPPQADVFAAGYDTRFILSFGPFEIAPGQSLPLSFAWVGGDNLHAKPLHFESLFDPQDPYPYYRSLDFSELAVNSRWASWVYDNPGVDTDGDGYAGEQRICTNRETGRVDTSYFVGDGIPDWRGAGPPPAPRLRVLPAEGKLVARWNGYYSETTEDIFSGIIDFEGYRVYVGRDERPASYSLVASYDRRDYNRYRAVETMPGQWKWVLEETPFTLDSLRLLFASPDLDPDLYTREHPYEYLGLLYYFAPQDHNVSSLSPFTGGIRKVYPDAVKPSADSRYWRPEDLTDEHGEPLPKYYEYEYVIEGLLPSVPFSVAVTAFDFGSPVVELPALETDPTNNRVEAYPQASADMVETGQLDVYVYPNPYRVDGGYRALGFEGRLDRDLPDDKVRALHFANLPARCTISIYSLDGDLIKRLKHDVDPTDPQAAHDQWNLITRNAQAVVSGLYYYVVESQHRTQIGKFVIIK